ncbi:unnamed protein product [Aphanomyces euteiches]|uniref:non-specific serine/threonine protein kinase n=1 Tax=Aphanomyces euteiches TaxID=100861 RepID=A0A6G0XTI7_9STRA|nr:hypothetical protein Ae201684_001503 [Aphanomyces euteiches]
MKWWRPLSLTAALQVLFVQADDCVVPQENTLTSSCYGLCQTSTATSCILLGPDDAKNGCSNQIPDTCQENVSGSCVVSCLPQPPNTSWTFLIGVPNRQDANVGRIQALNDLDIAPSITSIFIRPRDDIDKPKDELHLSSSSFRNASSVTSINIERIIVKNIGSISILSSLTDLSLSNVALSDVGEFNIPNPPESLESLDLSLNQLTEIPSFIYNNGNLQKLNVSGNPLSNIHVTSTQMRFLKNLTSFAAKNVVVTQACNPGYTNTTWNRFAFCVKPDDTDLTEPESGSASGGAPTPTPSPTKATSNKTFLAFVGLGTAVGLGIFIYMAIFFRSPRRKSAAAPSIAATPARISRTSSAGEMSVLHVMGGSLTDKKYYPVQTVRIPESELVGTPRDSSSRSTWTMASFRSLFTEIVYPELVVTDEPILVKHEKFDIVAGKYKGKKVLVHRLQPMAHDKSFLFLTLLSTLRHPRLLSVVGVSWCALDEKTGGIQMDVACESVDSGLLQTYLKATRALDTWAHGRLQLVHDITLGLMHIHEHSLLYGGVTTCSLLIDSTLGCKYHPIALAYKIPFPSRSTLHVAPEVAAGEEFTEAADMYSLGVLLAQIDVGGGEDWTTREDVVFSPNCPDIVLQLAKACLDPNPRQRPSASFAYAMICKEAGTINVL